MTDLLLVAVSDAFLDVGVILALVAVVVGLLGPRCQGVAALLQRRPSLGPVLGALLGITPGCSGALVVTPLFARGHVSLGTLVATLTATTGDSAWALWAGAPSAALVVHVVVLSLGIVLGLGIDALRARRPGLLSSCDVPPVPVLRPEPRVLVGAGAVAPSAATAAPLVDLRGPLPADAPATVPGSAIARRAGSTSLLRRWPVGEVLAEVAAVRAEISARRPRRTWPAPVRPAALGSVLVLFWTMTGAGTAVAVTGLTSPAVAGPELAWQRVVGLLGFVACAGVLLRRRALRTTGPAESTGVFAPAGSGLGRNLEAAAAQAAFVVLWVAGAYALLAVLGAVAGPAADSLRLTGLAAVVVGTLVGALPGCGFQIAWVGLYLDGAVDFPGLLANAVAQDGDALLPLVVLARRAAIGVTALTSVPALVLGGVAVVLVG
ncbi:putative manganese transporter [Aquipuribacter hungaricus]|uniref:Manganese transporter n=1 Tax=Aquipuribacter hungaricus TaxID=545624 RepID=A0ABV7WBP1_9MICO